MPPHHLRSQGLLGYFASSGSSSVFCHTDPGRAIVDAGSRNEIGYPLIFTGRTPGPLGPEAARYERTGVL